MELSRLMNACPVVLLFIFSWPPSFNLILYLFNVDYQQPMATSGFLRFTSINPLVSSDISCSSTLFLTKFSPMHKSWFARKTKHFYTFRKVQIWQSRAVSIHPHLPKKSH